MKFRPNAPLLFFVVTAPLVLTCKDHTNGQKSPQAFASAPETEAFRNDSRSSAKLTKPSPAVTAAVEGLKRGESRAWNEIFMGRSDAEQWSLLEQAYDQLHERRDLLAQSINTKAMSSKMPASLAGKLYDSLPTIAPPEDWNIPLNKQGWAGMQKIILSPKYSLVSAIMASGDKVTLARVWREFASLSEADQLFIGMLSGSCGDTEQVSAIAAAAQSTKSEDIRISLLDGASRAVARALEDPVRREAAQRKAQEMRSAGIARPLLLDALAKMKQP